MTPAGGDAPIAVAVLGSCISRDNFNSRLNPDYKRFYSCVTHSNQASIIALMSPPVEVEWEPTREMSDYDRWNVQADLTREFLGELVRLQPAYVVIDFFGDVHFGCVRLEDGRYVTDNRWKTQHTTWYQQEKQAGRLTPVKHTDDEEAYFALWCDAFDRFVAFARENLPDTVLVVHRGHNTNLLTVDDRPRPVIFNRNRKVARLDVPAANAFWSRLDAYAASVSGDVVIDILDRDYPTFDDHPWGAFYVHYALDYYHRFLGELHRLHLRRTQPALVSAMADALEDVRAEQAALDAARFRRVVDRLEGRLAQQRTRIEHLEQHPYRQAAARAWRRVRPRRADSAPGRQG